MNYNQLLKEVIQEARAINIPISNNINPVVKINTRAKTRLAMCKKDRDADNFTIEVSSFMSQAKTKDIKETLAHEILHTCPDCFNHGRTWQAYGRKMRYAYGYNIERTGNVASMGITVNKQRNYVLQCLNCKREIVRERMSNAVKHPENYRCKCGGSLTLL